MNLLNHSEAAKEPLLPWVETASAALATTVKKGLLALFALGKSPKISVLEAEPSRRRHNIIGFLEEVDFSKI
jgi:hypothetical protein